MVLGGSLRNQLSSSSRRAIPPSSRSHYYPIQSHVRSPNKIRWPMIWVTASVLSLALLGIILAAHC
jgi:hypothetical protein